MQLNILTMLVLLVFFGVNDVYDYETDRRNPRKLANGLEGSVLDPIYHQDVLNAAYCSTVFVILSASASYHRDNMLATIVLLILAWQYSSPPLRFKERPILDSISNGCIIFLTWFCGFSSSGLSISDIPPGKGAAFGLCVTGIHALVAVVDSEADAAAGQKTIVNALGERQAAIFAVSC
jgi:4-hydroxybenzoate polyprenyltransferase